MVRYHSKFLDRWFTFETCQLDKLVKKYKIDGISDANGLTFMDNLMEVHVWMPSFSPDSPEDCATLAHEILHAACFGLDCALIPLYLRSQDGDLNTEVLAYMVGEITQAFLELLKKRRLKKENSNKAAKTRRKSKRKQKAVKLLKSDTAQKMKILRN